ncbi:type VI secretion system baseplate subunit TssK, partial [Mesorhizobium sp.]|uniref:type VI secretion system baseplate subunit TssK n=1 Tax=Mesorhizobium sp. TaxID=1871066 RepID=UPI0025F97232
MPFDNKVIWSEGMFIRAQHFQQQARYGEAMARDLFRAARGYGWGFSDLRLNRDLLSIGKFALERAAGVFADGTPFELPADAHPVPPLELNENTRNQIIYLTLPVLQPGGLEAADPAADNLTRYVMQDVDVVDANTTNSTAAPVTIGKLRCRYALHTSGRGGLLSLGIARVSEVRSDNTVVLDEAYIPPMLDVRASPIVSGLLTEVVGLLNHRGEAIAARLAAGSEGTSGELSDTLMLQTINRW